MQNVAPVIVVSLKIQIFEDIKERVFIKKVLNCSQKLQKIQRDFSSGKNTSKQVAGSTSCNIFFFHLNEYEKHYYINNDLIIDIIFVF